MKYLWFIPLSLLRAGYFVYSLWCLSFPVFIGTLLYAHHANLLSADLIRVVHAGGWLLFVMALLIPLMVYTQHSAGDPNPLQSGFMSWFASLRWYWNTRPGEMAKVGLPSGFLVENPMSYRINGQAMRQILTVLQPGDILLRAYDGYLDGAFIRHSSLSKHYQPGWFTHAAMYIGELNEQDQSRVPAGFRHNSGYFEQGSQMVLHSMSKGVHSEDILTWCRCDYLAVLRIKPMLTQVANIDTMTKNHATDSEIASIQLQQLLRQGGTVPAQAAISAAKLSALEKIGEPYDFECITTTKYTRFSCAELVYYCFRGIHDALGLQALAHSFYPLGSVAKHLSFMQRTTVTPDDFYQLAQAGHLELVWSDNITQKQHTIKAKI